MSKRKDSIIPESDKDKTSAILQALHKYYSIWRRERKYIVFPELRLGSGYSGTAQRRIDFFVISSCVGNETTAFEIKVSKKDFKKDFKRGDRKSFGRGREEED